MDLTSLIAIVIAVIVIYLFIKFVVSPVLRVIFGIIVFLVLIYILQRFFGFNIDQVFTPFGIHFGKTNLDWMAGPVNYCINQIKNLLNHLWNNIPKPSKL
jgi:hypothetical protein